MSDEEVKRCRGSISADVNVLLSGSCSGSCSAMQEDLAILLSPMALSGEEPIGSMAPLAIISTRLRPLSCSRCTGNNVVADPEGCLQNTANRRSPSSTTIELRSIYEPAFRRSRATLIPDTQTLSAAWPERATAFPAT